MDPNSLVGKEGIEFYYQANLKGLYQFLWGYLLSDQGGKTWKNWARRILGEKGLKAKNCGRWEFGGDLTLGA